MLRTFLPSLIILGISFPTHSLALDFSAFACQPKDGTTFFTSVRPSENGLVWQIGDYAVEFQESGTGQTSREVTLSDVHSSTMLVLGEKGDHLSFRGLLGGLVVSGDCTEVTKEFIAAIEFSSPLLTHQIALTEEHLRQELQNSQTLKGQLESTRGALIALKEEFATKETDYALAIQECQGSMSTMEEKYAPSVQLQTEHTILEKFIVFSRDLMIQTAVSDAYREEYNRHYFGMLKLLDRTLKR